MNEPLAPNPHSPFATADPQTRHLLPNLSIFGTPRPGVLHPTSCGELAVVPDGKLGLLNPADPPEGLCAACLRAARTGREPKSTGDPTECTRCDSLTWHGELCAVCRQEMHDAWRDAFNTGETP
jgi:hypothetical protein